MQSIDQLVLSQLHDWLQQGKRSWLCTIVSTVGASPRPLGSLMALNVDGAVVGSLSGGCIEDDLLERLRCGELAPEVPEVITYGISAEENERLGLPCGGRLEVLLEPLQRAPSALPDILQRLGRRQSVRREVDLVAGQWTLVEINHCAPLQIDAGQLRQDFGPRYQLLLIGANELARCIAEIAQAMDYRVLVCDPRPQMLDQWLVEGAETLGGMPDDAVRDHATDAHSIVITLTHDPRIDDMALMEALTTEAFYVGALGSERTSAKRRERLKQLELSDEQIARLHAPVGLPIGSKSAMEIAVAIMAELTQLRAEARRAAAIRER